MFDVIALGGINLDLVLQIARLPGSGEKIGAKYLGCFPGGPVGNFACAASRLGAQVTSVAVIGDDENGCLISSSFVDFGVDTSFILKSREKETPFTIVVIEPSGERVVFVPEFDDRVPLDLLAKALPSVRAIYTMPRAIDYFLDVARLARQHDVLVMVDIEPTLSIRRQDLERIAPLVDVISFNEKGFQKAFEQEPDSWLLRELLQYGPRVAIVTLGERGALGVDRETVVIQDAFRVPVIDTTGAGDTFNAALLIELMSGQTLASSMQFACASSAISITAVGGRGHLPTRVEVLAFLESHSENAPKTEQMKGS